MDTDKAAVADRGSLSSPFLVHAPARMGDRALVTAESSLAPESTRRRTSPHDHAILEAAYQANSKPGKEERASVVSRVGLGEKEVQIWFQNRRQNDRRRSKPLQPHELIAHITNTISPAHLTPDPSQCQTVPHSASTHEGTTRCHPPPTPSPETQSSQPGLISQANTSEEDRSSIPNDATGNNTPVSSSERCAALSTSPCDVRGNSPDPPESQPSTPASSGRKRTYHDMMLQTDAAPGQRNTLQADTATLKTKEPLKRSSSVRLAMTIDGAVKIRTSDELTPSPEKGRSLMAVLSDEGKQSKLSRSVSMIDDLQGSAKAAKPTGVFGRSRDHRKWEFYCDNGEDQALSIQAEAERSGSAVGAINLIRSNSVKGRGLATNPALARSKTRSSNQVMPGKPKLSRAKSSLARLNSQPDLESNEGSKSSRHVRSSSDSDKENWAPGTRMSENALRRTQPSTNRRPVLQVNEAVIFPDASIAREKTSAGRSWPRKEKARGEDLDCIQGLLSLSQGAWR